MGKVVVIGSINADLVYGVERIPAPGETVRAFSFDRFEGGKGANQAVAAARMGAETVLVGALGADANGDWLEGSLKRSGVLTGRIARRTETGTGTALITVAPDGENSIAVWPGANGTADEALLTAAAEDLRRAFCAVFQLELPLETVFRGIRLCKELGVPAVLNPSPCAVIPDEILGCLSLLVVNRSEYAFYAGKEDPVSFLERKGIGEMIISLGAEGLDHVTGRGITHYGCEKVKAVDSTGAGDCLLGALTALRSEGMKMEEAIPLAMKAAAISVTRKGAQRSMPLRKEVL